ncbi:MAG: dihydropteroate synthase, partial [Acidobacteriaceae bacterium]|nr:dihydropteroate synthase [Acidobacteriaceae bacterium]
SEIIAQLGVLRAFDVPILVGPSRKSFLKKQQSRDTEFATAAAVAASVLQGAHIVRVHDVASMKAVVDVVDAIRQAAEADGEQPVTRRAGSAGSSGNFAVR